MIDPSGEALLGLIRDLSVRIAIDAATIARQEAMIEAMDQKIAELHAAGTVGNAAGADGGERA